MNKTPSDLQRCPWVTPGSDIYEIYHDTEWGVPVHDDRKHFEFLILEGAQAGLSWLTVLKRREGYRKAFANFDPEVVAKFTEEKVEELMQDDSIIRNKLKIRSCITNAKHFLQIQKEFGSFDKYIWEFVKGKPIQNHPRTLKEIPIDSPESKALSKDLKKRGFSFVGPTVMYAYAQATGLVNDHTTNCFCYKKPGVKSKWEVYMIEAESGMLYTGITTDLDRRFSEHLSGKKGARFFHFSSPGKIVFREPHPDRSSASIRESSIKKMNRKEKQDLIGSWLREMAIDEKD